jgi:hypothetical protein
VVDVVERLDGDAAVQRYPTGNALEAGTIK